MLGRQRVAKKVTWQSWSSRDEEKILAHGEVIGED